MSIDDVAGRRYGPFPFAVTRAAVAAFVAATGDDAHRWSGHAPPAFAAAALFTAAPAFLADPDVAPVTTSVVHTEQRFAWHRSLPVGEKPMVGAEVTGIRTRGSLHVVTFAVTAGTWLESTSTFLLSAEAAAAAAEEPEPAHDARSPNDTPLPSPLPSGGGPLPQMRRSASRADLVRYAAASGDWNPIHWDHAAARAAGLPGVIVHGLLTASWLAQAAARHAPGAHPLRSMRVRFREPLRPAAPAVITGSAETPDGDIAELRFELSVAGRRLVTATAGVTR